MEKILLQATLEHHNFTNSRKGQRKGNIHNIFSNQTYCRFYETTSIEFPWNATTYYPTSIKRQFIRGVQILVLVLNVHKDDKSVNNL